MTHRRIPVLLVSCIVLLALAPSVLPAQEPHPIVGVWRLVAFEAEFKETGQKIYDWGMHPRGYAIYTADGHFMTLVEGENRKAPGTDQDRADLWKTMIAYAGTYRLEGKTHVHHVESAWNPGQVGLKQIRFHTFDGTRMTVTTDWAPSARFNGQVTRGHLIWERAR